MASCENNLQIFRSVVVESGGQSYLLYPPLSRTRSYTVSTSGKRKKVCPQVVMGESTGLTSVLSCKMPFIVTSNIDKVDPATRKLIRKHVMRGKKRKKTDRSGADSMQDHRLLIMLQEVVDMYTILQPGCFGTYRYFVDFPDQVEPSILRSMEQGA